MSQESSYFIALRRKEAAVHSLIEIQRDLSVHLEQIVATQVTLENVPTSPSHGTYSLDGTLENKALKALFSKQWALFTGLQTKLERTQGIRHYA